MVLAAAAGIAAATMWYLWPWKRRRFTAVALDMDGTMLRSDHQLAPATVDCLRGGFCLVGFYIPLPSPRAP